VHEGEGVPLSVAKERHPQLMVWHFRDEVRLIAKVDAPRLQIRVGRLNIVDLEVQDRARVIELLVRRHLDHESNACAVEEGQTGRDLKEKPHPELIAIEGDGAFQILHSRANLPNRLELRHIVHFTLMRFILTPVGSAGDVHPFVGIGRALETRGHEVVVLTAGPFREVVQRAGLIFEETVSVEEFDALSKHPDLWHPLRGMRLVLGAVGTRLRPAYERLRRLHQPGRTVLVGHSLSFFTRVFEEVHRVPSATIHLAPSIFRSDHAQPAHAPGRDGSSWPLWIKRSLWWSIDRFMLDPTVAPALNEWRRELGLEPVTRVFSEWIHSPQRVIGLFPDWFGNPQPDWPSAVRLTGFPLYDDSDQPSLPPSLARFLDDGAPPLLFTPGTANQSAARFFKAALDASQRLGRRALLLTRYNGHLPTLPPTAHHESFVPLSHVLTRCAALVSHAGIGTLAQGLAAGVPQVTMPMGFDQPDNATRLQRLGVARWVVPSEFVGERVAAAISSLLDDSHTVANCRRWSDQIRAHNAIEETCDLLEQLA
jgi:rhamnosyltransferase subunit B